MVVAVAPFSGVTVGGEKEQEAPTGCPLQANETAELKPFCGVTVIVMSCCPPDERVNDAGEAPTLKLDS